jgi:hypothetical protein
MFRNLFTGVFMLVTSFATLAQTALPFTETWESGTFSTHGWTTNSGNGYITLGPGGTSNSTAVNLGHESTQSGINPVVLDSPILDGTYTTSGLLTFSFDYRFDNPDSTRWHYLKVYCNTGQDWELLHEFSFHASFGWKEFKTHLGMAYGKNFQIRFISAREADSAYGQWYVDNIQLSGTETPYFPLQTIIKTENPDNFGVQLLWNEPNNQINQIYLVDSLKPYSLNGISSHYQEINWVYGSVFNLAEFHNNLLYSIDFRQYYYYPFEQGRSCFRFHIIDWETKTRIDSIGPFITSSSSDWIKGISLNLKNYPSVTRLGIFLEPLTIISNLGFPSLMGDNAGDDSSSFRVELNDLNNYTSSWAGEFYMNLILYNPITDEKSVHHPMESKSSPLYTIYRWKQSMPLNYTLMNAIAQTDTAYFDTEVEKDYFSYYVQANYADGSHILSDTSTIYFPLTQGIVNPASVKIELSPNPAQQHIKLKSNNTMESAEIINTNGKHLIIYTINTQKEAVIPVSQLSSGIYILRIINTDGSRCQLRFIKE